MSDDETLGHSSEQFNLLGRHMENYNVEASALHRKLQSKVEALRIMRKELERFRTERDQFKLMAETLQLRFSAIKRGTDSCNKSNVANILHDTRERNLKLTTEVEALKQKLMEMQGDIELLREARASGENAKAIGNSYKAETKNDEHFQWLEERASFICHLEHLKKKNAQLAFDFKALIDEKEELTMERDAYKCKAHRLNHELLTALKANESHPKFLDIDSIILENKYLHERLDSCEEELDLAKQSANKYKVGIVTGLLQFEILIKNITTMYLHVHIYPFNNITFLLINAKTMLDSKRKKGIIKLGSSSNDESILSHKQVKNLLQSGVQLPTKTETIQDLKSLCLTLLDNLNDKTLALNHQKKTNKILGKKITELERRIQSLVGIESTASCSGFSTSQFLLQDYCPSLVDANETSTTLKSDTTESNHTEDSEAAPLDRLNNEKTSRSISDDGTSSLSTESARSVLSSEYSGILTGTNKEACSLSEFTNNAMFAYCTPKTSTTNSDVLKNHKFNGSLVSSHIEQERLNDLKDLPPELAALVQQALHELDLRDFETNVIIDSAIKRQQANESPHNEEMANYTQSDDDHDDEATVH